MTTLLVATTGGHLAQLAELAGRLGIAPEDRLWVTFDTPQSRSLLENETHVFIPFIGERDVKGVMRSVGAARQIMRRFDIDAVISTGSAIALAFLPYAATRGIRAHYIESSARVGAPSLTGRLLAKFPNILLYRQYPHAAGGRWRYGGSVFDAFMPVPVTGPQRPVRRAVVTLGSVTQSFRRLLERLVTIMPSDIDVFWQTGHTPVDGLGIAGHDYVPAALLQEKMRAADVVIAHGGCGSALDSLKAGRLPVLVPRDAALGEMVDDHQRQLATWLDARKLAVCRSPDTLTMDDITAAAQVRVERDHSPPAFSLAQDR